MNYSTELLAEVKEDINGISANGGLYIYASKEGMVEVRRSGVANYKVYFPGNIERTGSMSESRMVEFLLDNIYIDKTDKQWD